MLKDEKRILWLDVLRGVAILLVLLFHFTARYDEKYPVRAFADPVLVRFTFGWIGVHLFFMISGFIIYLTIQKKKGSVDFLVARLSRLVPPYWAAVLLILVLEFPHASLFHMDNRNDLMTTVANFFMIPDIFHMRFMDAAFWSLYVEVKFYVFFAILWRLVDMKKEMVFYVSYGVLFVFASIHNFVHQLPYGENFDYFLIFWTGIAACKVLNERLPMWSYALIAVSTTFSTIGFYKTGPELLIGIPVFSVLFVTCQGLFVKYPMAARIANPLSFLGRVSYSYYLVHQPVAYLILGIFANLALSHYLGIITAFVTCLGAAWLGFTYVEQLNRPIAAYVRGKIEKQGEKAINYL